MDDRINEIKNMSKEKLRQEISYQRKLILKFIRKEHPFNSFDYESGVTYQWMDKYSRQLINELISRNPTKDDARRINALEIQLFKANKFINKIIDEIYDNLFNN